MRVRVRFRYNRETGEVEMFRVDDIEGGLRAPDHDARHERVARDVGRAIVEGNPLIEELPPDLAAQSGERVAPAPAPEPGQEEGQRRRG